MADCVQHFLNTTPAFCIERLVRRERIIVQNVSDLCRRQKSRMRMAGRRRRQKERVFAPPIKRHSDYTDAPALDPVIDSKSGFSLSECQRLKRRPHDCGRDQDTHPNLGLNHEPCVTTDRNDIYDQTHGMCC